LPGAAIISCCITMQANISPKLREQFSAIKLAIFDVDGVLTDGRIYYSDTGQESKAFHTQDGAALKMLQSTGVQVALITGRESKMVARRAKELNISYVYQGVADKADALQQLEKQSGINRCLMSHTGDDLADLVLFRDVSMSISVPGAHPHMQEAADYVTTTKPGMGAVREICHLIMICQETWSGALERYKE